MRIIILAAGQGSRFEGLENNAPKCLLQFGTETILERQIRILSEFGISKDSITIVAGYKSDQLQNLGLNLIINPLYAFTDNSYSLGLALDSYASDEGPFIIIDGDLVFENEALADLLEDDHLNSLLLCRSSDPHGATGVTLNKGGYVTEIGKHIRDKKNLSYAGIMKLDRRGMKQLLPLLTSESNMRFWYTVPLNSIINDLNIKALITSSKVFGINTIQDYLHAKESMEIDATKILITGASGFLGKKLCKILDRNYTIIKTSKHGYGDVFPLDLLNYPKLDAFIGFYQPDIIIHTAAIADPDTCEKDQDGSFDLNVKATRNLCEISSNKKIKLIFISTDYVFDGDSFEPYSPDAPRIPKNLYGQTKVLAEDLVKGIPRSLIIRIPILYGFNDFTDKETFVSDVISKLDHGYDISVDNTQIRYPVLIDEVAIAISSLLHETGTIQISSNRPVTKYQWARIVADTFNLDKDLITIKDASDSNAKRPPHIKMDTSDADSKGILIHDIDDGLKILRKQMNCIFKLIYQEKSFEKAFGASIGEFRYELGELLSNCIDNSIISSIDCVVPVPNSGLYYGMGVAASIKKPYVQALVKTDSGSRSFNIENSTDRFLFLRSKIIPIKEFVNNKKILLVDEAIFTGITLRTVCDMLKACGAKEIHVAIPTPVCTSRCHQYMQPDRPVLSEGLSQQRFYEYFRVDSVTHLSNDIFSSKIEELQDYFCCECFQ